MRDPIRLERCQRWKSVFETTQGQSVLEDLRKMTGADITSVMLDRDGRVDSYHTILKEGRRSVWVDIRACLTEPPDVPAGAYEDAD